MSLIAQSNIQDIKTNNEQIIFWTDSLEYFQTQIQSGKISDIDYQIAINRISSEISILAGNNIETTYQIVDSIQYSAMEMPNESIIGSNSDDSLFQNNDNLEIVHNNASDKPMKIKMPLGARIASAVLSKPQKRTKTGFNIGFGFNTLTNSSSTYNHPTINWYENLFIDHLMLNFRTRLGNSNSKFGIVYGIGFDYLSFKQKENWKTLINNNGKPVFENFVSINNIDKVKLRLKYLRIPLGLDFSFNKHFSIQISSFYDLLVRQRQYITTHSTNNDKTSNIESKDFGLNKHLIGMHYQFGWGRIYAFAEHNINSILNDKADYRLELVKFGIGIR